MSGAILLTGATGFLGMEALAHLIERGGEEIVVLVRAKDDAGARALLLRAGVVKPDPRDYLGPLLAYAQRTRWGKQPITRQAAIHEVMERQVDGPQRSA